MKTLSLREQKFVDCFIQTNGNLRKAAIDAGYSENGAARSAFRLLKKNRIKEAIEAAKAKLAQENQYTRDRMFKELQDIIREAQAGEYPNFAAVLKAKEMQCKMLGYLEPEKEEAKDVAVSISVLNNIPPTGGATATPPPENDDATDYAGEG